MVRLEGTSGHLEISLEGTSGPLLIHSHLQAAPQNGFFYPYGFFIPLMRKTSTLVWATCASSQVMVTVKNVS